jgi:hypothetical protein
MKKVVDIREFSLECIQLGHHFSPLIYSVSEDMVLKYAIMHLMIPTSYTMLSETLNCSREYIPFPVLI